MQSSRLNVLKELGAERRELLSLSLARAAFDARGIPGIVNEEEQNTHTSGVDKIHQSVL